MAVPHAEPDPALLTSPDAPTDIDRLAALALLVARYETLWDIVPLAVALFDEDLALVRANARYRELTGLGHAESLGRSIYDAFPNALADLLDHIDVAVSGAVAGPIRVAFQQRSGPRAIEVTFAPVVDGGNPSVAFFASDVTEREELREDLARSVAQLATIFDVIPESVRVFDAEGTIVRSNTQAQRDHGASKPTSLQQLWQLDLPRTPEGTSLFLHEHPTARALRGERVRGQTLAVRRASVGGGQAVVEVSSNPLRDTGGRVRGAVTVERDVTERQRLASELEEQVRIGNVLLERVSTEAERLERMVDERTQELLALQESRARERRLAAVGQLAAGVMHDVNNALNPIVAAAYLLQVNADNPAAVRDYAARIAQAAETGAATASRVGRFIRQDPPADGREERVDLASVADEVVAITRPLWAERARGGVVRLELACTRGTAVRGITGEIREALMNLIQNALDAMAAGGGTLGVATGARDGEVWIEVRDTGSGMSAEVRERAFEPFFTTKGHGGTGLGLAEVYGIMKRHRGRAEIESESGRGTVVRLVFPAATAPTGEQAVVAARPRPPRRVLVVEDNDDGREFMCAVLVSDGHTVDSVASVREALDRLGVAPDGNAARSGTHQPRPLNGAAPYDVLLTDVGLPDGSGWEVVAAARVRWPALRIGVVTGWESRPEDGGEANFTLRKPVRTVDLLARVAGEP